MSPERDPPGTRRPDGNLLDPEAFWDATAREPGAEPDPAPDVEEDLGDVDTDVCVVRSGEIQRPPLVVSRPAPPAPARPRREQAGVRAGPVSRTGGQPARRVTAPPPLDLGARSAGRAGEPGASAPGLVERLAWLRIPLAVLVVAGLSGGLGWLLLGRQGPPPAGGAGGARATAAEAQKAKTRARPARPEAAARTAPAEVEAREVLPEEAEPAEVGEPATIRLTVLSDPSSAEVLVDGEFRGLTPVTVEGLAAGGEVGLKVQTRGYRPWEQRLSLDTDQPELQITAGLQKEEGCPGGSGWVYVVSEPAGASVELDGKRLPGRTPLVIDRVCSSAPHKLLVQSPGRQAWSGTVQVQAGEVHNLNLELKP